MTVGPDDGSAARTLTKGQVLLKQLQLGRVGPRGSRAELLDLDLPNNLLSSTGHFCECVVRLTCIA